jgi:hypothetical protein
MMHMKALAAVVLTEDALLMEALLSVRATKFARFDVLMRQGIRNPQTRFDGIG